MDWRDTCPLQGTPDAHATSWCSTGARPPFWCVGQRPNAHFWPYHHGTMLALVPIKPLAAGWPTVLLKRKKA